MRCPLRSIQPRRMFRCVDPVRTPNLVPQDCSTLLADVHQTKGSRNRSNAKGSGNKKCTQVLANLHIRSDNNQPTLACISHCRRTYHPTFAVTASILCSSRLTQPQFTQFTTLHHCLPVEQTTHIVALRLRVSRHETPLRDTPRASSRTSSASASASSTTTTSRVSSATSSPNHHHHHHQPRFAVIPTHRGILFPRNNSNLQTNLHPLPAALSQKKIERVRSFVGSFVRLFVRRSFVRSFVRSNARRSRDLNRHSLSVPLSHTEVSMHQHKGTTLYHEAHSELRVGSKCKQHRYAHSQSSALVALTQPLSVSQSVTHSLTHSIIWNVSSIAILRVPRLCGTGTLYQKYNVSQLQLADSQSIDNVTLLS